MSKNAHMELVSKGHTYWPHGVTSMLLPWGAYTQFYQSMHRVWSSAASAMWLVDVPDAVTMCELLLCWGQLVRAARCLALGDVCTYVLHGVCPAVMRHTHPMLD